MAQLAESDETEVQTLGEPQVSLVDTSPAINVINTSAMLRSTDNKSVILIVEERVDSDEPDSTVFWGNMGNGSRRGNFRGSLKGNGAGRGVPPPTAPPPMIPPGWGQPPWTGMSYYPPYMALPAPPTQGTYFPGEYHEETSNVPDDFRPPSPPKGPRAEAPKTGQKRHHFETEQEDLRREVRKEKAPPSHYERRKAPADRVKRRSPSPDVKDALEDDDYEIEPPVLISFPQLDGPLAFTPEALKNWGRAHLDQSEQSTRFHAQLKEWKETKRELHKTLAQAYEDTRGLKEHVVSNDVTQEHLYTLHIQVKRTAKRVREASRNVDQLIDVAVKQMTLNVDAVRDFGTVLRTIPFDALEIPDFYRSIRSFYVGLIERLVQRYGKNNPTIFNVAHSFENFLQICDFLEPLPGGFAQFTGMMAGIIRDVYHIDLDELKESAREAKGEPGPSRIEAPKHEPALTKNELKAMVKEAHAKTISKREQEELATYEAKADRVVARMQGADMDFSPGMKAVLAEAMKLDEREFRAGRFHWKEKEPPRE